MELYLQFVIENWYLFLALVAILGLLVYQEKSAKVLGIQFLAPQEVVNKINRSAAVIVDIRDDKDFNAGHIIDAIHIQQSEFDAKLKKLQKYKQKPVIVVCADGQKSAKCALKLRKVEFSDVFGLKGGINAWQEAGYPLTKSKTQITKSKTQSKSKTQ